MATTTTTKTIAVDRVRATPPGKDNVVTAKPKRTMNRVSNAIKFKIMKEMEDSYTTMGLPDAGFARAMSAKFNVTIAAGTISTLRKDLNLPLNKSVVTRDALDMLEKDLQDAQKKISFLINRINSDLPDNDQLSEEDLNELIEESQVLAD